MHWNEDTLKGKWKELKGEIQKTWGNITGDELEQAKGNVKSISGLIQQKYGHTKEEVSLKMEEIAGKFSNDAKKAAVDTTESVKEDLRRSPPPPTTDKRH